MCLFRLSGFSLSVVSCLSFGAGARSVCVWVDMKFINLFHVKCIFTIKCTTPVNLQCSTREQSVWFWLCFHFGIIVIISLGLLSSVEALQLLFTVVVVVYVSSWQCTRSANAVAGTRPHRKRNARRTTIKQIMAFSSLSARLLFGRVQFRFCHICNI